MGPRGALAALLAGTTRVVTQPSNGPDHSLAEVNVRPKPQSCLVSLVKAAGQPLRELRPPCQGSDPSKSRGNNLFHLVTAG